MKKIICLMGILLCFLRGSEPPFKKGVNFTNWFQASSPWQIHFKKFTRQDFVDVKSLGCDVIRLPINLHHMTDGAPDYKLDSLFLYFLDQVVDITEELDMHLILDNHTFDPATSTDPNVGDVLVPVWTQMAEHFKNRSVLLYYEILNEPHGIADHNWNSIQQNVIDAIRSVDQKHAIIVGPAGWNSYHNLQYMPEYKDDNLIYTFHFYDPFLFTHQGASWVEPSMESLAGVPFPYIASEMPECPSQLKGTWLEGNLNDYSNQGTVARVRQLLDIAIEFKKERDVPLFCGEFGVYQPNSDNDDRVFWYNIVRKYMEEHGIAWTMWDYRGGFGLFEEGSNELFDYDLNIPLVDTLGFNIPDQFEYNKQPDTAGFDIYKDFIGPGIIETSWIDQGLIDYYSKNSPYDGKFCIYWTGVNQYSNIGFEFKPVKDLSVLVDDGYVLDFWVKGDTPNKKFDIRFIDTKKGQADHPWRMGKTIDGHYGDWNNEWQHIQIPLSELEEKGSWDEAWYEPQGKFNWQKVKQFQIVAEHYDLQNIKFWFDNIKILHPDKTEVTGDSRRPLSYRLFQNYPNPYNDYTKIKYTIPKAGPVVIEIYNLAGQKIETLVDHYQEAGQYELGWQAAEASTGVYLYRLKAGKDTQTKKMILLK
jgi:endoglucanase